MVFVGNLQPPRGRSPRLNIEPQDPRAVPTQQIPASLLPAAATILQRARFLYPSVACLPDQDLSQFVGVEIGRCLRRKDNAGSTNQFLVGAQALSTIRESFPAIFGWSENRRRSPTCCLTSSPRAPESYSSPAKKAAGTGLLIDLNRGTNSARFFTKDGLGSPSSVTFLP